MKFPRLLPIALLLASTASADVISGRVVDPNGNGVAGVDLDFTRSGGGGGNAHEMNDGTDANGFFTTTVDADVWDVLFYPPTPPATTLLGTIRTNVNANGPINIGTIVLQQGVSVSGTVRGMANIPVAGVKINANQTVSGQSVLLKSNTTSAFGLFSIAVPGNVAVDLQYLTANVFGQTLAPREVVGTTFTANTNVGNVDLLPGHHINGTVRRSNGTNISGADIDVFDAVTGDKLYTPGDNTTVTGTFDVIAPAGGLFDLMVCAPAGFNLVAADVNDLALNANTNVGILTMLNGVVMSGTIRDRHGVPMAGADVNVYQAGTNVQVPLCDDNAAVNGTYAVIVPIGVFDVVFSPNGPHLGFQKDRHNGVSITASFVLNGRFGGANTALHDAPGGSGTFVLPMTSSPSSHHGAPAIHWNGGVPSTSGAGATLAITGGAPGAVATALLGLDHGTTAGRALVRPALRVTTTLDAAGTGWIELPPLDASLAGRTVFAQFVVPEPGTKTDLATSPILGLELR